jgi:probable phosphoglycerate mutase
MPIGERLGLKPEIHDAINEIDMGEWSGQSFKDLHEDPRWQAWNSARAVSRPPKGESMLEVQARVIAHIERTRAKHPDGAIVLVSHSDVIKTALLYCLGMSLNSYPLIEIGPASITTLAIGDWGAKVLVMNEVPP